MTKTFKLVLMSGVAASFMAAGTANATDGMFSNGFGNASKGMAGAGSALSLDTQAAVNNPAAMRGLGNRVDAGISVFSPRRAATVEQANPGTATPGGYFQNAGKFQSKSEFFYIPSAGVNYDMGDYSLGLTMTGNGGMNTDYKSTIFAGGTSGKTGIDLAQMLVGLTYSRNVGDKLSIGITPTLAAQRFKATGLQGFAGVSSNSAALTDRGYDYSYGYGLRVGIIGKLTDKANLGVTYQSRTYMQEFDKYAGLFAEKGDLDIPAAMTIGTSYQATNALTLAADYKRIFYSDVRAISNSNNVTATSSPAQLGTKTGLGFGWQDMDVFKLGAQYDVNDAFTVRGGMSYNSMAMDESDNMFNILAPAVPQYHASAGFTYKLGGGHEVGASFVRTFDHKTSNDTNVNHATNSVDLEMNQYEMDLGYTYKF